MLRFVTRAQWGARPAERKVRGQLSDESTCHWNGPTVTVGGKTVWDHSRCAGLVRGIQNFHMDSRGWSDIAYNFLECPHGYTFEGRGFNIINGANGTNDGNQSSHAICCIAGEGNPFPDSEKVGFKAAVKYVADHTFAPNTCKGHRDHKSTECPGNARYTWVHNGMPVKSQPIPSPTPPPIPTLEEQPMLFKSPGGSIAHLLDGKLIVVIDNANGQSAEEKTQLANIQASMPAVNRTPVACSVRYWERLSSAFPVIK